ncbi:DUF2182 domain-containing protein [Arthrobacter sunyaminii]|uniref:DUF2182 domain-containing protein n=1 Tax=Arthrobacter sunyaminii TaxID=2816859 RepID=UPI001A93DD87|nr:DUF2182 domain-containing protein [Arthrobacter sunyaminii]MBO0898054.1 DUF2182 domain-containing protein [Arthrobacter sunyaminii]
MTPTSPAAPHQSGASRPLDMNLLVLSTIVMAAMAWGVLLLTHGPGGHGLEGHTVTSEVLAPGPAAETHAQHGGTAAFVIPPALVGGAVALGGWGFMVVAMMLPPALPLLQTVRRLASHRPDPWRLTIWSAMTFIGAWMVIGAVLVAGDLGVRALASSGWPAIDPRWVTGAVLIGAGGYQFTPLKDLCLRGCRSPRSFVLAHWQGRRSASAEIFALSGAYALSCIGCCWALMLICFTVGTAALPAMVALSVVMAAERLVPWGRRLVWPTGFALIAMGAATALIPAFDSPI